MGWMTWNLFQGNINEQLIRETADAMVEGGFRDAGYEYIFIDDLWQGGRDRQNNIIPDPWSGGFFCRSEERREAENCRENKRFVHNDLFVIDVVML